MRVGSVIGGRHRLRHQGATGFAYGIGQRKQVVMSGFKCGWIGREPQNTPSARRRHSLGVCLAQVVTVRLGIRRERAENGGLVGIDISQRRDRRL